MPRGKLLAPRSTIGPLVVTLLQEGMDLMKLATNAEEEARARFAWGVRLIYVMERHHLLVGQMRSIIGPEWGAPSSVNRHVAVARHFDCDEAKFLQHYRTYVPPFVRNPLAFRRNYKTVTDPLFRGKEKGRRAGVPKAKDIPSGEWIVHSIGRLLTISVEGSPDDAAKARKALEWIRRYCMGSIAPAEAFHDPYFVPYALCCSCGAEPPPEGHKVVTERNLEYPLCQSCSDASKKPDYLRVAHLYRAKSAEDARLLDDVRSRLS